MTELSVKVNNYNEGNCVVSLIVDFSMLGRDILKAVFFCNKVHEVHYVNVDLEDGEVSFSATYNPMNEKCFDSLCEFVKYVQEKGSYS